jgi:hypothetical protein
MMLASLALLVTGGLILIALLAAGLADPPRAGALQWRAQSLDGWLASRAAEELTILAAPVELPASFTLELTARNDGPPASAWGIQLNDGSRPLVILIHNQGYFSVSAGDRPHWAQFIHLRSGAANRLYLHVEPGGTGTLRLNDEVAWQGVLPAQSWGVALYRQPQLSWQSIALYHE